MSLCSSLWVASPISPRLPVDSVPSGYAAGDRVSRWERLAHVVGEDDAYPSAFVSNLRHARTRLSRSDVPAGLNIGSWMIVVA